MDDKPKRFYIGVTSLLAILIPGFIATLAVFHFFDIDLAELSIISETDNSFIVFLLFLLSACLLGYIISQLSAYLDAWLYAPLENHVYKDQKRLKLVKSIRDRYHPVEDGMVYLSNFDWARALLIKELPAIVSEIEQDTAEAKFFRGLIPVFLAVSILFAFQVRIALAVGCILIMLFAVVQYFQRYRKATETAYKYVIFLENRYSLMKEDESITQPRERQPKKPPPAKYTESIQFLTKGFNTETDYIEVTDKYSRDSYSSPDNPETICCLAGKGWLYLQDITNNQLDRIWLSPNGSLTVPPGRGIKLENPGGDSISLILIAKDKSPQSVGAKTGV